MDGSAEAPPRRELRLALVLNGGVSLAVWMAGVTHELNECRLAAPGAGGSRSAWQDVLEACGSTVTIDLVAGSSAGGLNGSILANAIGSGASLPSLKRLWQEQAALTADRLLPARPRPRQQLLDGQYLEDRIDELVAPAPAAGGPGTAAGAAPADCSLLVTATALVALAPATAAGDEADSRRVYRFVRRTGVPGQADDQVPDQDDFRTDRAALVRAARASTSYPGAFQPVQETPVLQQHRVEQQGAPLSWLMDGGVLDNTPFGPLLDELLARPVGGAFDRALLYINPAVGSPAGMAPSEGPGVVQTLGATVSAFREPDRRLDRERLSRIDDNRHYEFLQPYQLLRGILCDESPLLTVADLDRAAAALFPQYTAGRRQAYCLRYAIARDAPELAELLPAGYDRSFSPWGWGLGAAERILRWFGRVLRAAAPSALRDEALGELRVHQVRVSAWRAALLTEASAAPDRLQHLQGYFSPDRRRRLAELMLAAASRVAEGTGSTLTGAQVLQCAANLEVVNRSLAGAEDRDLDLPPYDRLEITPAVPPALHAFDALVDSGSWPRKKLYGELWGHFGAFASERGRAWDWLWGRLDAAAMLSDELMRRSGVEEPQRSELRSRLVQAVLAEDGRLAGEPAGTPAAELVEHLVARALVNVDLDHGQLWRIYRDEVASRQGRGTRKAIRRLAERLPADYLVPVLPDTGLGRLARTVLDLGEPLDGPVLRRGAATVGRLVYRGGLALLVNRVLRPAGRPRTGRPPVGQDRPAPQVAPGLSG